MNLLIENKCFYQLHQFLHYHFLSDFQVIQSHLPALPWVSIHPSQGCSLSTKPLHELIYVQNSIAFTVVFALTSFVCKLARVAVFMESFQGCYRNSPRDCRYFADVCLMLPVTIFITCGHTVPISYPITTSMTILTAIVVAAVKPFKSSVHHIALLATCSCPWFSITWYKWIL